MSGLRGALAFLTRLPLRCSPEDLKASLGWYTTVGLLLGLLPASALTLWPGLFGAFWATNLLWLSNGGLHLDGLADSFDAGFSGASGEKFITVLKDSRLGTFGALGLLLVSGGNLTALTTLDHRAAPLLLMTVATARLLPPCLLAASPYVGLLASPHAAGASAGKALANLPILAALAAFLALRTGLLDWLILWSGAAIVAAGATLMALRVLCRKGGGLRGDFLGFSIEFFQTLTLTLCAGAMTW